LLSARCLLASSILGSSVGISSNSCILTNCHVINISTLSNFTLVTAVIIKLFFRKNNFGTSERFGGLLAAHNCRQISLDLSKFSRHGGSTSLDRCGNLLRWRKHCRWFWNTLLWLSTLNVGCGGSVGGGNSSSGRLCLGSSCLLLFLRHKFVVSRHLVFLCFVKNSYKLWIICGFINQNFNLFRDKSKNI
jgi:hypothetical protein